MMKSIRLIIERLYLSFKQGGGYTRRLGGWRIFRSLVIMAACALAVVGCKGSPGGSAANPQQAAQQPQQSGDIAAAQTEPYSILRNYHEKKLTAMGKLLELASASEMGEDELSLDQFQQLATRQIYDADKELSTAMYCMSRLEVKAENDWSLQHERYSGYMDLVDGEYRFEFFVAEEEETETHELPDETSSMVIDPLETAETLTEPPPMIPTQLAGYIEGRMVDGSNRMAMNAYSGREEEGTRAQTLWFEFLRDTDGGYWTQYYYAWDNVGTSFYALRVHVYGDGISYAILESTDRPGSIFSLQLDEDVFFSDAASLMRFDGASATYTEGDDLKISF